jgi:energy-converting hydrogenase B subunit D
MLDFVLTMATLATVVGVVFIKKGMHAVLFLSAFSMIMTLRYALLGAPDVAMTEAALGVGLSSLVFVVAVRKTGGGADD